ncbi:MAG: HPr(Ser) kinase/phosphatase [Deltaproteobacteria bacterium]|nr:HPr(Ser) kinase/phosphatase [Deltaproteobacteria bacterium]
MRQLKVSELRGEEAADLQLRQVGGSDLTRVINSHRIQKPGLALTGYTDFVQKGRVQILGSTELSYLEKLDAQARAVSCSNFCACDVPIIVCTKGMRLPEELVAAANASQVALFATPQNTDVFIARVEAWLEDRLAPQTTMHGVLLEVFGVGVLLLGKSGIGKSELALDLVQRGHRLVADDMVLIRRRGAESLLGAGTALTKHNLEVRGLGILNISDLFGVSAVRDRKRIELVAELVDWREDEEYDRLGLDDRVFTILDVDVPLITVPVRAGRNMGVILEVAARNQLLKQRGRSSAQELHERLQRELARGRARSSDVE